jgi:antitoxin ParD1/3/4
MNVCDMKLVTIILPESYLEGLHELVREGMYPSRSAAIRMAIRDMLKTELWKEKSLSNIVEHTTLLIEQWVSHLLP